MKERISERLREALERRGRSIRSLQQDLEAEGVPGSSYANVHAYMAGRTQQSVEFLDAAARLLAVNPEWLAFGKEPMTPEDAIAEAQADPHQLEEDVAAALRDSFPAIRRQVQGPGLNAAWRAWNSVVASQACGAESNVGDMVEIAERVGEAMQSPLRALGIQHADLSLWQLEVYATLVGQAIQVATVHPTLLRPSPALAAPEEASDAEA